MPAAYTDAGSVSESPFPWLASSAAIFMSPSAVSRSVALSFTQLQARRAAILPRLPAAPLPLLEAPCCLVPLLLLPCTGQVWVGIVAPKGIRSASSCTAVAASRVGRCSGSSSPESSTCCHRATVVLYRAWPGSSRLGSSVRARDRASAVAKTGPSWVSLGFRAVNRVYSL
jgi:hypothetical protein